MQTGYTALLRAPILAGIVSLLLTAFLCRTRSLPLDKPNDRSLHAIPLPRAGGIAVVAGVLVAAAVLKSDLVMILPAALLAMASFVDDFRALPVAGRLALHLIAAGSFLWLSGAFSAVALVALVLAMGWLINLYNFMDGADGLAGGMATIGFATFAIAAGMQGAQPLALLSWSIAAAAAGFLVFNLPPAKIFMGDVGSIPLGFLAGAIGVAGWQQMLWPLWFPLLIFSPFVMDATVTLVRRALRGEPVWQAHRQHYYQRLILSGWSHRRTALSEYAAMVLAGGVSLVYILASDVVGMAALSALAALMLAAMWSVDRRWRRFVARQG
jgi:UDP-N-acetylmuramyl pentapeptide phosphotransferase/UDP-N-acetylglucosamine-1-phosphate transferase